MAVVATQLVEQTPPTLEICGSNPVFRKFLLNICLQSTVLKRWEVVVAQLVERSLSIPEVRGSNPVIGKIY